MSADPYNLDRFLLAQEGVFRKAVSELQAGAKRSHWMWFVFPQLKGLGRSSTAFEFGISGLDEARAYLQHPVLGARLKECTQSVLHVEGRSAAEIFGSPDDMKFRSSLTLFSQVSPEDDIFRRALDKYFEGVPDRLTLNLL